MEGRQELRREGRQVTWQTASARTQKQADQTSTQTETNRDQQRNTGTDTRVTDQPQHKNMSNERHTPDQEMNGLDRQAGRRATSHVGSSQLHSNSVCLLTQGEVFGLWFCVVVAIPATVFLLCVAVAIPAIVFPLSECVVLAALALEFWSGMVSDGFQTQRRGSWIPGKERAEKVLAGAIAIDGRKEWICKFCSESNVWTRWRCRRWYSDILAGLCGKYRQAIAARTREW